MFTLKKPLLLIVLLGIISLSLCEQERNADEDEESETKRGIFTKINKKKAKTGVFNIIKTIGKEAGMDVIRAGIDTISCKIKGEC
uniref:Esculentin-1Vb n=1 Tax=Odorrana versabilis TaxID=326940 RepID=ES1VB_ODOVE|nr:RecName: Full=Esculentin-1Vb; Short=esc1Vb; AltName: Full=Esculentin 1VEb; Flags: Precursor [Odorrana versabilis]CAJ34610.1 esculentin 1Vb precursor [Odorrana versabilis]